MTEYALLTTNGRDIKNVVTSAKSLEGIRRTFPDENIVALSDVPQAARERYEYWSKRP